MYYETSASKENISRTICDESEADFLFLISLSKVEAIIF